LSRCIPKSTRLRSSLLEMKNTVGMSNTPKRGSSACACVGATDTVRARAPRRPSETIVTACDLRAARDCSMQGVSGARPRNRCGPPKTARASPIYRSGDTTFGMRRFISLVRHVLDGVAPGSTGSRRDLRTGRTYRRRTGRDRSHRRSLPMRSANSQTFASRRTPPVRVIFERPSSRLRARS